MKKAPGENRSQVKSGTGSSSEGKAGRQAWKRILLLIILGYEGAGAIAGGILLIIAPDGRLMDMPVEILHGVFPDFLAPGFILLGLGILNSAALVSVLLRSRSAWLLSGAGLGGLVIWFITEIIILRELHWLHAMWGIPVLLGCLLYLLGIDAARDLKKNP